MKRLHRRIMNLGNNSSQAMGQYHPATTPATPMVTPMAMISYVPSQQYPWTGTAVYDELVPVWAPDGALIAARTPGWWGQDMPLQAGKP
jgi:hypothetical protein